MGVGFHFKNIDELNHKFFNIGQKKTDLIHQLDFPPPEIIIQFYP